MNQNTIKEAILNFLNQGDISGLAEFISQNIQDAEELYQLAIGRIHEDQCQIPNEEGIIIDKTPALIASAAKILAVKQDNMRKLYDLIQIMMKQKLIDEKKKPQAEEEFNPLQALKETTKH